MRRWRLSWGGRSWCEDDATGDHLALVVAGVGSDSWDVDPSRGPVRLMAWLAAFVALADGRPWASVLREVRAASASTLLGALSFE